MPDDMVNPVILSLVVFLCVFGAGYLATVLRAAMPEHHLSADTKDTVKLSMGLVATMTALVLGLLVASAKGTYDVDRTNIINMAAKLVMLDRLFGHYGPEAAPLRVTLRESVQEMVDRLWPDSHTEHARLDPSASSGDAIYFGIESLPASDDLHRGMKARGLTAAVEIGHSRWLLLAESASSISFPLLLVVVFWLSILFFSFGLFAPPNATAVAALFISALSVAGAIFLIIELATPFDGVVRIPSRPMHMVLDHLGK